jgi:hypothetical protein
VKRLAVLSAAAALPLVAAACLAAPTPSPTPSPSVPAATPTATATASPRPTEAPSAIPVAPGSELVDIPQAGIRLAVPSTWEQVSGDALADPAARADVIERYPGMAGLLDAAELMGDRATPALLALDPASEDVAGSLGSSVSVLVAQPAVSGPLLDFIAGFISDGLAETFDSPDPVRSRLDTPVGEAVRLQFDLPAGDGPPTVATAYVIGAAEGTLLVTVIGSPDEAPASDPDAVVLGASPLP